MTNIQPQVMDDFELRSADSIRQILDIAEVGLWEFNFETGRQLINQCWAEMLGFTREELSPLTFATFTDLLHPDDKKVVLNATREHTLGQLPDYRQNFRMKHKLGHWIWIKARGKIIRWDGDKPQIMTGLHLDISEVMRQSDLIQGITDVVPSIIYQLEMTPEGDFHVPFVSKKLQELFGLTHEEIRYDVTGVKERIHPDDAPQIRESMLRSATSGEPWVCEYRVCLNNTQRWMLNRAIPQNMNNGNTLWHGMTMDISLLKETELSLHKLAMTDGLTQWYNRRHFMEIGEKMFEQAKRQQNRLSMLMFDIDYFKTVNDNYGHPKGDEVLQHITRRIGERIRTSDLAARLGGEEFVVLLDGAGLHDARNLAEDLRKQVESLDFTDDETVFRVTCSFGVTMMHTKDETLDQLVKRSDDALYRAKANGRNRVELG